MTSSKNIIEDILDENLISAKDNISELLYMKMSSILEQKREEYIPKIFSRTAEVKINESVASSLLNALDNILTEKKREYSDRETIYGMTKDEYMKLTDEMKRKVKERFYFERERVLKKKKTRGVRRK